MSGELSVSLNGFRIEFSSSQFELYSAAIPDNSRVEILREKLGPDWFIYWRKGIVYGLPRTDSVVNPFESAPRYLALRGLFMALGGEDRRRTSGHIP